MAEQPGVGADPQSRRGCRRGRRRRRRTSRRGRAPCRPSSTAPAATSPAKPALSHNGRRAAGAGPRRGDPVARGGQQVGHRCPSSPEPGRVLAVPRRLAVRRDRWARTVEGLSRWSRRAVKWRRTMAREETFDSFYRSTRRVAAPGVRADRGPGRRAERRPRRLRRRLAPLAQGGAARGPARTGSARAPGSSRSAGTPARIWHRNKGISADAPRGPRRPAKLPVGQRRALLLVQLAGVPLAHAARELGCHPGGRRAQPAGGPRQPRGAASTRTRRGSGRGCCRWPAPCRQVSLPRASIIRRAGRKRRQVAHASSPPSRRLGRRRRPARSPTSRHRAAGPPLDARCSPRRRQLTGRPPAS